MDAGDIRKALFYTAYVITTILVLLYLSGYTIGYNPLTYYFPSATVQLFAITLVSAVWFAYVLLGRSGSGEENRQPNSSSVTITLVFFVYISTFLSIYYLQNTVHRYYEVLFLGALIPLYTIQDFRRKNKLSGKGAGKRARRNIIQDIVVLLAVTGTGYLIIEMPVAKPLMYVYLAASVLLLSVMAVAGRNYDYSRNSYMSLRIVIPYAAVYLIYQYYTFYNVLNNSGIVLLGIVTLAVLLIAGFLVVFRRRKGIYAVSMFLLFVFGVLGIFNIIAFYKSYATTLLILISVIAWFVYLSGRSVIEDSGNIWSSFKVFNRGAIYFVPVFAVSLIGFLNLFQFPFTKHFIADYNLSWFYSTVNSTINYILHQTLGITSILFVALSSVAVSIGSKKMNVLLYLILGFFFVLGLFYLVSLKVAGVWDIPDVYENFIVIVVTVIVFYEPTFRFMRSYSNKISRRYSLSYQMGAAKYLRGRFDVDTTVDKKKNKDYLGAGGFAYVFKGRDILNNQSVVVKMPRVFDEESKTEKERRQQLQEAVRQLYEESKILGQIDYPGIVKLVDYFKEGDHHYLVEEFADGKNLSHILGDNVRNGTPLDEPTTLKVALSLLFSVNYLHLHEIYHRDLNPGNIVLSKDGPKIIDFGTSKILSNRASTAFFTHSQRIGVPCYHPPELDIDDVIMISASYDTYSVGAVICSMLTGKFLDNSEMKRNYGYEFINEEYLQREIRPLASDWFFKIISRTLAYKSEDRYQSAFEMIADIMGITGNYIVTDLGHIFPLERDGHYDLVSNSAVSVPELGSNLIRSKRIELFDESRNSQSPLGRISYANSENMYRLQASGRKNFYLKTIGAYPDKRNDILLVPRLLYGFRQDLSTGSFSFYSIR